MAGDAAIEPLRALVLGGRADGFEWVWQFGVYPLDETHTRLVSRNSALVPRTVGSWLFLRVIEPTAFLMTRPITICSPASDALPRISSTPLWRVVCTPT
jgi:hypothetical protein